MDVPEAREHEQAHQHRRSHVLRKQRLQGTSEDQARTKAVRKLVRAIIEEEGGNAQTTEAKIDTNYRRGIVWYHDVLTNNSAKFGTKFKELMEKQLGATAPLTSCGGEAGAYKHVSGGDFPIAALCGAKKQFNSVQVLNKTTDFVLIQYNVHSLINFEERMQRVLHELEGRHWDAVAFAETWRSECDEAWKTRWGHSWFGSGGTRGTRGVGILLHSRWAHALFRPVSERLCVLDVKLTNETVSIFSVYMPHADYPDEDVDVVYAQLDVEMARSKNRKTKIVIASDWNARVGQAQDDDDDDQLVGQTNYGHRSERGTQFVKWCTLHGYMVANTFSAETDQMWTYQNGKTGISLTISSYREAWRLASFLAMY